MTYLIASLAKEMHLDPQVFLDMEPTMFRTICQVFDDEAKEREKIASRNKRFG